MAKFLFRAQYSPQGLQGAVKEGFGNREDYIRGLIETVGGTTEAWYFSYGLEDLVVIIDAEPAAAVALSPAPVPRASHPEEVALPALEAFLSAIVAVRASGSRVAR